MCLLSRIRLIIAFLLTYSIIATAQIDSFELERKQYIIGVTTNFINLIHNSQYSTLAEHTHYPLMRQYPVPNIISKQDFLNRYNEIFDDSIIKAISFSDPEKDWRLVGWRGIVFLGWQVWLNEDGDLIAVNHQSNTEKKRQIQLIEADRKIVHPSLRMYKMPICVIKTSEYQIRIDELHNGKYRYTSWPLKSQMIDLPLLNMTGDLEYDGNGGNRYYSFKNAGYTYTCYITVIGGDNDPPAELIVTKGEKEIIHQKAILIGN